MPWVLLFVVMVTGIISSLGAPLIPSISDDLGVSLSAAQWSLTATLLVGVVDLHHQGEVALGQPARAGRRPRVPPSPDRAPSQQITTSIPTCGDASSPHRLLAFDQT